MRRHEAYHLRAGLAVLAACIAAAITAALAVTGGSEASVQVAADAPTAPPPEERFEAHIAALRDLESVDPASIAGTTVQRGNQLAAAVAHTSDSLKMSEESLLSRLKKVATSPLDDAYIARADNGMVCLFVNYSAVCGIDGDIAQNGIHPTIAAGDDKTIKSLFTAIVTDDIHSVSVTIDGVTTTPEITRNYIALDVEGYKELSWEVTMEDGSTRSGQLNQPG